MRAKRDMGTGCRLHRPRHRERISHPNRTRAHSHVAPSSRPTLAHNRTVRKVWILGLAVIAVGCGGGDSANKAGSPAPSTVASVAPPSSLAPTELALFEGPAKVKVGDSADDADKAFPMPPGAFPFKEIPAGFQGDYRARGYDTSRDGFGVILYDNRVALAMRREENLTSGEITETFKEYQSAYGDPHDAVLGARIQYWFWEAEGQRLMLCAVPDSRDSSRIDLTIAVGDHVVMDALRMNIGSAREDRAAAEKALPAIRHPG